MRVFDTLRAPIRILDMLSELITNYLDLGGGAL
jgi:hypothetical protein